jgi:hypothetical protein
MPIPDQIYSMMRSSTSENPSFPPTILFNEGWLLRLILDWFSRNSLSNHPLSFPEKGIWFSEAYLPSAFAPRYRGDPLGESSTHADGAIGHFTIGASGKADLSLLPNATHFTVLEAKMFSKLSSGVTNARYFDQAARNVACIAETLSRTDRNPADVKLGFFLIAPQSQIEQGIFEEMEPESIQQKVERRVREYKGERDQWYLDWCLPTFENIECESLSWEKIISEIGTQDTEACFEINDFYFRCLRFNQATSKK